MSWAIWALLSAFFAGLTAVLAKVGVTNVDTNLATAVRTAVVLVFTWIVAGVMSRQSISGLTAKNWLFLTLSGAGTAISWLCYFRALKLGKAAEVAPVDKLSVVVAMAFGAIFLGEALTWKHWTGGVLIVAGALLLIEA
jgi:transporter family protein